jgi:hypothetical protein
MLVSMHMRYFWQDVTIPGVWYTELFLHWDLGISIHTPSTFTTTWYVCDYAIHCALDEYSNVYMGRQSRTTNSQLTGNFHHHLHLNSCKMLTSHLLY